MNFGTLSVDCASRARVLTVYDPETPDVTIEAAAVGAGDVFHLEHRSPLPAVLQPGDSFELAIVAQPPGLSRYSGAVELRYRVDGASYQRDIPLSVEGAPHPQQVDRFQQAVRPKVDMLWVIDDGLSMQEEQPALRERVEAVAQAWADAYTDPHFAVTTTSMEGAAGQLLPLGASPEDRVVALGESVDDLLAALASGGATSSGPSRGLDAARAALGSPLAQGVNRAFLRRDAPLHVVFVSDRDDASAISPSELVSFLTALKDGVPERVKVSAVVTDEPTGCTSEVAVAEPAPRYVEAANLSGGSAASICDAAWPRAIEPPYGPRSGPWSRFYLTAEPVLETLRVFVDDVEVPRALEPGGPWYYSSALRAVVFAPPLESGAHARAEYRPVCL